tara:strand:- start:6023 stop:7282 length:1260 start_codon:yes stop_codon:yes gene_type:complete
MNSFNTVKGTHDILPEKSDKWQNLEKVIHRNTSLFGYKEIRTPIIEKTDLFIRGIGESTDVVSKEMYSWIDKDETAISLRPEMTAAIVRSYIQHSLGYQSPLQRLYYIGPCFRRERPQKGRQRQFHQFGVEAIGSNNPEQDAEIISLGWEILLKAGIKDLELKLSSVGSSKCRSKYIDELVSYLKPYKSKLSEISRQRLINNPLRILDTKNKDEIEIISSAPTIDMFYTDDDRKHFNYVQDYLKSMNIPFSLDPLLVRGLDYYSHTTFEIISNNIGAQNALLGGGRYNKLIKSLGGKDTPAIGFAAGMERVLLAISDSKKIEKTKHIIHIVCIEPNALGSLQKLAKELRTLGLNVVLETMRRSMKAQMREANKCNADYVIIVGEEEYNQNTAQVKRLNDGTQKTIDQNKIFNHFKSLPY